MKKIEILSNKAMGACFFIVIISCSTVFSQTSQMDGDWDDTSTWDNAMVPQPGDNVVIRDQVDIDVDTAPTLDIASITIDNSGALNIQDAVDINAPITVGDGTTNGTLNISTTGTVEVNAISVDSDGNFNITSSATLNIITAPIDILGNFDITGSADINTTVQVRGTVNITDATTSIDDIDITNSGGIDANLTVTDGASLTVTNDVDVTGGNQPAHTEFNITDSGVSSTVTINGDLNYIHNNTDDNNSGGTPPGWKVKLSVDRISTLNISGNFTYMKNGNPASGEAWAEIDIGPAVGGSTAALNVTGTLSIDNNPAPENPGILTFRSANDATISVGDLILTTTKSNILDVSDVDVVLFDDSSLTVTGTTTYNYNDIAVHAENEIWIKVSELGGAGTFTTANLIMNNANDTDSRNLLLVGYNNATINLGNVTFTKGAGVSRDDTRIRLDDNSILNLSGDITNQYSGSWDFNDASTLVLNGTTGAQTLPDPVANDFQNLTINNTSGSPIITFQSDADIFGTLTLTSGVLTADLNTDEIIIQSTSVVNDGTAANAGSAASYIDGKVIKIGNSDFTFPIGKGGKWARLGIANLTGVAATAFTAEYFNTEYTDIANLGVGLNNVSGEEYWDLSLSGTSDADLTLYWEDQSGSGIDDQADFRIAHYTGGQWEDIGQDAISFADPGDITVTGVSSFSPFTFGSGDAVLNPLPVELIYFHGILIKNHVELSWSTASEINNDYFIIERSADGIHFESLEQIDGAGNSTRILNYKFTDDLLLSPIAYYRLKQVDFDGKSGYSNIVHVERSIGSRNRIMLHPNPIKKTDNDFSILLSENLTASDMQSISLVNANGQEVSGITFESTMSKINVEIPNHVHYSPGVYLLKIVTMQQTYISKLIVE